jgi:hypothetical protein
MVKENGNFRPATNLFKDAINYKHEQRIVMINSMRSIMNGATAIFANV